jgi:hypothetical protein
MPRISNARKIQDIDLRKRMVITLLIRSSFLRLARKRLSFASGSIRLQYYNPAPGGKFLHLSPLILTPYYSRQRVCGGSEKYLRSIAHAVPADYLFI